MLYLASIDGTHSTKIEAMVAICLVDRDDAR